MACANEILDTIVSTWLLALVATIYVGVAISYVLKKDYGMALAFIAYALANVGFIWSKS